MMLTKEEQIRREEDLIIELEAKVEIWQTLYKEAKHCAKLGMEPAIAIVHARHGLNAAKEQLHAHRASLETIKKRVSE